MNVSDQMPVRKILPRKFDTIAIQQKRHLALTKITPKKNKEQRVMYACQPGAEIIATTRFYGYKHHDFD